MVWNLTEASSCPGVAPAGRGRGVGAGNASWIRALPGDYKVRLTLAGSSTEQPLSVRLDPRVSATADDLQIYSSELRAIESIECSVSQAMNRIQSIDAQIRRRRKRHCTRFAEHFVTIAAVPATVVHKLRSAHALRPECRGASDGAGSDAGHGL